MTQMYVHCGYCGRRFYLASPCYSYPKVLDWATCDDCLDRFRVYPRLAEVLQGMRGFERQWFASFDPDNGQQLYNAWNRYELFNSDLERKLKAARNQEIYRRLRRLYRGESLEIDGVKVTLRDLNYESVSALNRVMGYWGGSHQSYRWMSNLKSCPHFVVRQNRKVVGYLRKLGDIWASTTNPNIVWWAWTERDSREGAIKVLLATAGLVSQEGNEQSETAIIRSAMDIQKAR